MRRSVFTISLPLLFLVLDAIPALGARHSLSCERAKAVAGSWAVPLGDSLFALRMAGGVLRVESAFQSPAVAVERGVQLSKAYVFAVTAADPQRLLVLLRQGECQAGCAAELMAVSPGSGTIVSIWSGTLPDDAWELQVFRDTGDVVFPGTSYWWVLRNGTLEGDRMFGYCAAPGRTWSLGRHVGGSNPCQLALLGSDRSFSGFAPPGCFRIRSTAAVDLSTAVVVARHWDTEAEKAFLLTDSGTTIAELDLSSDKHRWWSVSQMGNFALLMRGKEIRRVDARGFGAVVRWPGPTEPKALEGFFSDWAWFLDADELCRCQIRGPSKSERVGR